MRITIRRRLGAAVLALAAGLTAACAPGSDESSDQPTAPSSSDSQSFEGKTLTYVYFTDGPDEQATRDAIASFEQETGATVNLQIVPFADLATSLQARLSAGDAPEVARVTDWHPYADQLVNLTDFVGDDYADQFIAGAATNGSDADGNLYAVPSDITINGPLINLDAFAKAGVEVPTKWTWEELLDSAKKVADANKMPFAVAIDKSGNRVSTLLSQFGTVMLDEDGNALDKDKAAKALTFLTDMLKKDESPRDFWLGSGSKYTGANEIFLAQKVPVYLSGPWQVGAFSKAATFQWAAVPNPCEERCGGFPGGKYMVAFSGSKEPALAAAFVEFMNSADTEAEIDKTAYWMPGRQDLADSGVQYADRAEDMSTFVTEIAETPEDTWASVGHPAFTAASTALIAEIDKVVSGQEDVATAVDNLSEAIDEAVADTAP